MQNTLIDYAQDPLALLSTQTLAQVSIFLPRIIGALLVLVIGAAIARLCKRIVVKGLEALSVSKLISKTPVDHFLKNAEVGQKLEEIIGTTAYWLIMLVVLHTTVEVLGLTPVADVLNKVLAYIPQVLSAILVLFFGVLLAGLVESLVKGSIRSIDGKASRLLGKISSYLVMTIGVLVAVSELGIASEYIMILFVGFVTTVSLGLALALGLGGKDIVSKMLEEWYEQTRKEIEE